MGYTFAAALFRKTGTAPATRKVLRESMESMGYRRAASAEEASLSLRLYQHIKSAWLGAALEMPEDLDKELEFLRGLAVEMHTSILYFMNFDSDLLFIAATDGADVQHVHIGYCEEDDLPPDSDDLSLFDAMLPDDAAREEFRRILAVDEEERIFSESAAGEMAPLFGYTPEVLFTDEETPVFAELNFDLPGGEAVPFLMPEDAPSVLAKGTMGWGNPARLEVASCGGKGRGIRVLLKAVGYDAKDWELPWLTLSNEHVVRITGKPAEIPYDEKTVPQRVKFQDGGEGWMAEFPDAPIYRGVNPKSPMADSMKAYHYHAGQKCSLTVAFRGGTFKAEQLKQVDVRTMTNPAAMAVHHQRVCDFFRNAEDGKTLVWIIPMENPDGGISHSIPREPMKYAHYWPEDDNDQSE